MQYHLLQPNAIVRGALCNEPVQIIAVVPLGESVKLIGSGLNTGLAYQPILTAAQIATLAITPAQAAYNGEAARFRLGIEAMRLAIAWEYDP